MKMEKPILEKIKIKIKIKIKNRKFDPFSPTYPLNKKINKPTPKNRNTAVV
jgi:hypothetical protein